MMRRMSTAARKGLFWLALAVVPLAAAQAEESLLVFKNGRALRVVDYRTEGDWVFFMVSEPKPEPKTRAKPTPGGEEEDDGPSEMGVHMSSIDHIEAIRPASVLRANGGMRHGNGPTLTTQGPQRVHLAVPGTGQILSKAQVEKMAVAKAAARGGGGGGSRDPDVTDKAAGLVMPEPDVANSVAGQKIRSYLNKLRVPNHIMNRAKQVQAERRAARARARAQKEAGTPTPAPAPPKAPADGSGR